MRANFETSDEKRLAVAHKAADATHTIAIRGVTHPSEAIPRVVQ